jgi:PAS domain S-box-containing protein
LTSAANPYRKSYLVLVGLTSIISVLTLATIFKVYNSLSRHIEVDSKLNTVEMVLHESKESMSVAAVLAAHTGQARWETSYSASVAGWETSARQALQFVHPLDSDLQLESQELPASREILALNIKNAPIFQMIRNGDFDRAVLETDAPEYKKAIAQLESAQKQFLDRIEVLRLSHLKSESQSLFDALVITALCTLAALLTFALTVRNQRRREEQVVDEMRFALDSLGIGVWTYFPDRDELRWDDFMLDLYGLTGQKFSRNIAGWNNLIVPAAEVEFAKVRAEMLSRGGSFEIVLKTNAHPNGTHYVGAKGMIETIGGKRAIYGVAWDHTGELANRSNLQMQKDLLAGFLDNLPVAVIGWSISQDSPCSIWNKEAERVFGLGVNRALGAQVFNLLPEHLVTELRAMQSLVLSDKKVCEIPSHALRTNNSDIVLRIRLLAIENELVQPTTALCLLEDITEASETSRYVAVSRSVDRVLSDAHTGDNSESIGAAILRAVCDGLQWGFGCYWVPNPISGTLETRDSVHRDSTFARFQSATAKYTLGAGVGLPGMAFKEQKLITIYDVANSQLFVRKEFLADLEPVTGFAIPVLDGTAVISVIEFMVVGNPKLTPALKSLLESIAVRVGQFLLRTRERSKAIHSSKLASLGEMAAGIAHEINNPLAIIGSTARALPKFASTPDLLSDRIDRITKSVDRIAKIVASLRKFSRTSDQSEYGLHAMKSIIEEALILTEARAKNSGASVTTKVAGDRKVWCNDIELEQVLVNLVNNALDAIKQLAERWVEITYEEADGFGILRIRDSGSGISDGIKDKLFQPFFTTKAVGDGTGLGLSIVRGIIEEHKGTIELRTDDPHTCFEIKFNLAEATHCAS